MPCSKGLLKRLFSGSDHREIHCFYSRVDPIPIRFLCGPALIQVAVPDGLRPWNDLEIAKTKDEGINPCPK